LTEIGAILSVNGREPLYAFELGSFTVGVVLAKLGAPSAVGTFEELHYFGAQRLIVLGPCGVVHNEQQSDRLVIPTAALRDEGTSYHYAPPSEQIAAQPESVTVMEQVFEEHKLTYDTGITWTTDAFFRETRAKALHRVQQGAKFVDMEASALMAWSQFRSVELYQFFYTADCINQEGWQQRKEQRHQPLNDFFLVATLIAQRIQQEHRPA
jgi:uridine phosphorylase